MAPQTRSSGVPPPSRIYSTTPSLQQIDFVSTMTELPEVALSDSEEDGFSDGGADKENGPSSLTEKQDGKKPATAAATETKRRRTVGGDESDKKRSKRADGGGKSDGASRRKTTGGDSYHTQTLTQFLNRELVQDSQDDDDGDAEFDDWLQESPPESPSPSARQLPGPAGERSSRSSPIVASAKKNEAPVSASRQSSVIPQTPTTRSIRFEIPSSSQLSTPPTGRMLDRSAAAVTAGLVPLSQLPGKPKARKVVIEDSFATESWGSNKSPDASTSRGTPLKDITGKVLSTSTARLSSSATDLLSTPTRPRRRNRSAELGETVEEEGGEESPVKSEGTPTPRGPKVNGGVFEIPDSDEDDEDDEDDVAEEEQEDGGSAEQHEVAETPQGAVDEEPEQPAADMQRKLPAAERIASTPEDDDEGDGKLTTGAEKIASTQEEEDSEFIAGAETQSAMNELASTAEQSGQGLPPPKQRPLRKPLDHGPPSFQSQFLESQRVPLATIQSFGPPTHRTDVLLRIPWSTIDRVAAGYEVDLVLPYKVLASIKRFWLVDEGSNLRYCACVEPVEENSRHQEQQQQWRYHLTQVYELNNPLGEDEILEEGWMDKTRRQPRYVYLPPAGVSQLLANLRHALFGEDGDDDGGDDDGAQGVESHVPSLAPSSSYSTSLQVEAQLRGDMESDVAR
ncbi:hypothetical protein GMORB2_7695 [Geosmithia morbida]|uniref:Uncharacterized protein n=1 Tax=Geosmithia morbida TaxID=1094350 RepID=A0A9P5D0X2_9HYPO|nr:uncharacterized protein GMORB2_7695 [Geosmithia morbida]KAF4122102.1 hypothetical protein GMORB2_7695 [Geosmithia morbida]